MVHPVSKQRRKVLSEDEYTATLSAIVQRDFFPELPELERQAAVLERRAQGDIAGAVAVRRAARRLQQHEEALAAGEAEQEYDLDDTSDHHATSAGPVRRRARPLHQESISGFHARVTNEDDDEFDSNQKKEIWENRERLEKLFRPDSEAVPRLTNHHRDHHMASDDYEAEPNRIAATEWNRPAVRNGLFLPPTPLRKDPSQNTSIDSVQLIANGSSKEESISSSSLLQLALMPAPPARPLQAGQQQSRGGVVVIPKHQLVEYVPKHALEKRIEPSQTRFPNHQIIPLPNRQTGRGLVPASASASGLESETDGSVTDASTDLDAPLRPVDEERRRKQRRIERNRDSYVAMTPLIVPGGGGGGTSGNESPIMTWGTIDSTPLVLSGLERATSCGAGGGDPTVRESSSYSLAGETERERAARKAEQSLARRAKRAKTTRKCSQTMMASSSSSSNSTARTPSLTPAAMALWQKNGQRPPSRARDAFASSLRSSYTPKLQAKSGSSTTSGSKSRGSLSSSRRRPTDNAFNATPLASRN